jgi:succinate-semialdehyde dehydrogenase/glutarate-semialdehyde dehydrogenase
VQSRDPTTEETFAEHPEHDAAAVEERLLKASLAFLTWGSLAISDRAVRLRAVSRVLRMEKSRLASLMTREMGKPVVQSEAEVEKCAWALDHYADNATAMLAPERIATDASESFVRFDPIGPVLAIMPWNFPLWQVFRCAAPILAAGNPVVLKHASNVMGCARAIEDVFARAGFEPGIFTTLVLSAERAEGVVGAPAIRAVTLTGSERAGARVAALAGQHLKKSVLELGGSDPFIVLRDADLELTVSKAVQSRTLNAGQSCISAKRFIVERSVSTRFVEAMVESMRGLRVGNPMDRETDMGPLARRDLQEALQRQVDRSVAAGARGVLGGEIPRGKGYFYPATVLSSVAPGMPVFDEETFGPVAAVTEVDDLEEAVALANRTEYGLGASIWTADLGRARATARRLECGSVFVNELVKSDPRMPFGGTKHSGYGRELGLWGIREFVNAKTVWVAG